MTPAKHNPCQGVGWYLYDSRQETVEVRVTVKVRRVQGKSKVGDGHCVPVGIIVKHINLEGVY